MKKKMPKKDAKKRCQKKMPKKDVKKRREQKMRTKDAKKEVKKICKKDFSEFRTKLNQKCQIVFESKKNPNQRAPLDENFFWLVFFIARDF